MHTAIMYDINLSIAEELNSIKKEKNPSIECDSIVPICNEQSTRTSRFFSFDGDSKNYFYYPEKIVKTDNFTRKYPFFKYIEEQLKKPIRMSDSEIQKYGAFFHGLSSNKKIKFYKKITDLAPAHPGSNLQKFIDYVKIDEHSVKLCMFYLAHLKHLATKYKKDIRRERIPALFGDFSQIVELFNLVYSEDIQPINFINFEKSKMNLFFEQAITSQI